MWACLCCISLLMSVAPHLLLLLLLLLQASGESPASQPQPGSADAARAAFKIYGSPVTGASPLHVS